MRAWLLIALCGGGGFACTRPPGEPPVGPPNGSSASKNGTERPGPPAQAPIRQLRVPAHRTVTLPLHEHLVGGATYVVRVWLKAPTPAVLTLGKRQLPYNTPGRWQHLADVVRSPSVLATASLRTLATNHETTVLSTDLQLEQAPVVPALPARKLHGPTELVSAGRPAGVIVYPAKPAIYRALAERLQRVIVARCGVKLPLATDLDVTDQKRPILRPAYRRQHLILLGRLGLNRAMWASYGRFLSAVDGYYPGVGGFVVRTASNVLRNGANHIIVGSSDDAGVTRAVERFEQLVARAKATRGMLSLPWALEVDLRGAVRKAFDDDDALWVSNPSDPRLPRREAGYQSVARFYANAMGYYWSGRPSYLARTKQALDVVLADQAYTHHYIVEFFVRAFDMLDDSLILGAERTRKTEALLAKNFWQFLTGPDLPWMKVFAPPYDAIPFSNHHAVASFFADLYLIDFLRGYFRAKNPLADVLAYRWAEKTPFARHWLAHRWKTSLPRSLGLANRYTVVEAFFRYALHHQRYGFFERGQAARALGLPEALPSQSVITDHHLLEGMLASYLGDGRYAWLLRNTPSQPASRLFQWRYVAGVHRYVPGAELRATVPHSLAGVRQPRFMSNDAELWKSVRLPMHRPPTIPLGKAVERVTFRSGFGPTDLFASLEGYGASTGALRELWAGGQQLLAPVAGEPFYGRYNAVNVLRTDRAPSDEKPYASAARLDFRANFLDRGAVSLTMDPFAGTVWRRDVVWLPEQVFVVRDVVTAKESGDYLVSVGWHAPGVVGQQGASFTVQRGRMRLQLTPLAPGFGSRLRAPGGTSGLHLGIERVVHLAARQGVSAIAVLQAHDLAKPPYQATLSATDVVRLERAGSPPITVHWAPHALADVETDARVLVRRPDRLDVYAARRLRIGQTTVLAAGSPQHIAVDLGRKTVLRALAGQSPKTTALPVALQKLSHLAALAPQTTATILARPTPPRLQVVYPEHRPGSWRLAWSYRGLQRPALLPAPRALGRGRYDFGRLVRFAEIRATRHARNDIKAKLPPFRFASSDGPRAAWLAPTGRFAWLPGVQTGNYGKAVPTAQTHQTFFPVGLRARYVEALPAPGVKLAYYDADKRAARTPLRLELGDLTGDGRPEIVVVPRIFPKYLRPTRDREDWGVAILLRDGRSILTRFVDQPLHDARLLQPTVGGPRQLYVVTADARLRRFDGRGRLVKESDLYAMHQRFQRRYGRKNTRQPAGLYTMPFAVGNWRPSARGQLQTVISRYVAFTFLDSAGQFIGLNARAGGYVLTRLLERGLDVDGDGQEETFALGHGTLWQLGGSASPRVLDKNGTFYYPQVYKATPIAEPKQAGGLDGSPVHIFEALPVGVAKTHGKSRYLAIARRAYLGIFDATARRWGYVWRSAVPILAAAITRATSNELEIVVVTAEHLLWRLRWQTRWDRPTSHVLHLPGLHVRALAAARQGGILLACRQGLYRWDGAVLREIAPGAFQDVRALGHRGAVVAITGQGAVVRYDRRVPAAIKAR